MKQPNKVHRKLALIFSVSPAAIRETLRTLTSGRG